MALGVRDVDRSPRAGRRCTRETRRHAASSSVVAFVVVVALVAAGSAFAAFGGSSPSVAEARVSSRRRHFRGDGVARAVNLATSSEVLDGLVATASGPKASEGAVATAVEEAFAKLTPEDLADLQGRMASAKGDAVAPLQLLTQNIQAMMDKRMVQAKADIDALLVSDGDIDANIRACLKKQDTALPIMAVLQMNLEKAQAGGAQQQAAALGYILTVMSNELEKEVPLVNRVIGRLLSCTDAPARKVVVREALQSQASVSVKELAEALVKLVEDAETRFSTDSVGGGEESQTLKGTLGLIRQVALDCAVIIGEVVGPDAQEEFVAELTPLFEALSK